MRLDLTAGILLLLSAPSGAACNDEATAQWLGQLRQATPAGALRLAYALDAPADECQAETLIAALSDPKTAVRRYSARALGDLSPSPAIAEALITLLRDSDRGVREHAALALIKEGRIAVPALVVALGAHDIGFENPDRWAGDDRPMFGLPRMHIRVSDYASIALIAIGEPAAEALLAKDDLSHDENIVLNGIGLTALPALRRALWSAPNHSRRRLWLSTRILNLVPNDVAACKTVEKLIAEADPADKPKAILQASKCALLAPTVGFLFTQAGPLNEPARASFEAAISSEEKVVADAYWQELTTTAPAAIADLVEKDIVAKRPDAIPLLRPRLTSLDPKQRQAAADLISYGGAGAASAVPDLVKLLKDPDEGVRWMAVSALGRLGPIAQEASPALVEFMRENPPQPAKVFVGVSSPAWSLARVADSRTALEALLPMLGDRKSADDVVDALSSFGSTAAPAVPRLVEIISKIKGENAYNDFITYFNALKAIGAPALDAVIDLRKSPNPDVRYHALLTASRIDPADTRVLAAQREALADPAADVRGWAAGVFGRPLQPADAKLLGDRLLVETDAGVRSAILERLRKAGSEAVPALDALRKLSASSREAALTLFIVQPGPDLLPLVKKVLEEPAEFHSENSWESNSDVGILLEAASSIWRPTAPLLESDNPQLIENVLDILERAPEITPDVLLLVQRHVGNANATIRSTALRVITKLGLEAVGARKTVLTALVDTDPGVRSTAARAMEAIADTIDAHAYDTAINDEFAQQFFARQMKMQIEAARPPEWIFTSAEFSGLPLFPLPPPRWSAYKVLEPQLLGPQDSSLRAVHAKLSKALDDLGYDEQALFGVPGGFALATQLERIDGQTGAAFRPPDRWTRNRLPPRSLHDYLETLFFEKPGVFRLFVFVITPMVNLGAPHHDLTEDAALELLYSSGRVLPDDIGALGFAGRYCHVLVYSFEKRGARAAIVLRPDPLGIARQLAAAGIVAHLAP